MLVDGRRIRSSAEQETTDTLTFEDMGPDYTGSSSRAGSAKAHLQARSQHVGIVSRAEASSAALEQRRFKGDRRRIFDRKLDRPGTGQSYF